MADVCGLCGGRDLAMGYGLASGGLGAYQMCLGCDEILWKQQDAVGDCLDAVLLREQRAESREPGAPSDG